MNNVLAQGTLPFSGGEVVNGVATIQGFERVFANVVSVALGLAGIVLFVMLIVGGLKYITSAGNPKNAAAASSTITSALLGIVLVALAFLFLQIISAFTGLNLTIFRVTI
jgi:hypothetical protein